MWMSHASICEWYGIKCDKNELVTSLNLTNNGLKGRLPMLELFQALRESLQCFDVSHNAISGSISGSLSTPNSVALKPWSRLQYFYVNDNHLTGSVPLEWFNMSSESPMLGINMAWNLLSGELPGSGFYNLEALNELYLSHNLLVGSLPSFFNLPSLGKCWELRQQI